MATSDAPRSFADVFEARLRALEEQYLDSAAGKAPLTYISTGFRRLDDLGLGELGVLTTIGGHSGDGKSVARKMLAWNAAAAGHRVQEWSFEDPGPLSADRVIADAMDVDSAALRRLKLGHSAQELPELVERFREVRRQYVETARRICWEDRVPRDVDALMERIKRNWEGEGGETKVILIDYAQMFDATGEERSLERIIARLAGELNQLAADKWVTVYAFSQVKKEVVDRGRRWFESAKFAAGRDRKELGLEAVQGFRPGDGDLQWSSALIHRSKVIPYIFRPGRWARKMGIKGAVDNVMEWSTDKLNFAQDVQTVAMGFDGTRSRLWDPKESPR